MMKTTIVTASDADFYPLLRGLLASLEDRRPAAQPALPVTVLDVGLLPEQVAALRETVNVVAPGWMADFPGRENFGQWFQAMIARPYLSKIVSGYDLYIWLDADAWVQDYQVIQILSDAA